MSLQALASDTATLAIARRLLNQHAITDVVNMQCSSDIGQTLHHTNINNVTPTPAQGIVTEIVALVSRGVPHDR